MNDIIAMLREARHARENEIERIDAAIELLDPPDADTADETADDGEDEEPDDDGDGDDDRPNGYPCPVEGCDFVAKTGRGLGPHARSHRSNDPEPAAVEAPAPELSVVETVTLNTQCAQCGSLFPNRRHLELHGRKFGHEIDAKQ